MDEQLSRLRKAVKDAVLLDEHGDTNSAIQLLEEVNQEFPNRASVKRYLGWFLASQGKYPEAIDYARMSVDLASNSELSSLTLFHALWDAGSQEQAIEEAKRFKRETLSCNYDDILDSWNSNVRQANYARDPHRLHGHSPKKRPNDH